MIRDIKDYEAFFLDDNQVNFHLQRHGLVLLSLPESKDGALHALKLYQPQRPLGRLSKLVLDCLVRVGLYQRFFRQSQPFVRELRPSWDFAYAADTVGIMLGSSAHKIFRAIASYRGAAGWEVAKLGRSQQARVMLGCEAEMLRRLDIRGVDVPRCLGLHESGNMTVMRMPYLSGAAVDMHDSDQVLDLLSGWLSEDQPRPISEFGEWEAVRRALEGTSNGLESLRRLSHHSLRAAIVHGDFARWNLLRDAAGRLIAMDWEWGSMDGMGGLDLVHFFSQNARMVDRRSPESVIQEVESQLANPKAIGYLRAAGWGGCLIEPILVCYAYHQGAGHQKKHRLLEVALNRYLSCKCVTCEQHGDVAQVSELAEAAGSGATTPQNLSENFLLGGRKLRISVVTPSYKQVDFLKCCAASVRDQVGDFQAEHLIHDGGSGTEFDEWARVQQGAVCVSERDGGMYEAINRGFRKANGDIIAWLNCDEQYLPGTLDRVARYFAQHPDVDILFGDVILVDDHMMPLAYRRAVLPSLGHIRFSHLSTFSAATFVRRRTLDAGHFLQTRWKTIADAVWIEELLVAGFRAGTLHEPLAIFGMLGSNLGQSELLFIERQQWECELGATNQWLKRWYILEYRLARILAGAYSLRKVRFFAYINENQPRVLQQNWVSGQWSPARNKAAHGRLERDGAFGGLELRLRHSWVAWCHALLVTVMAVYVDNLVGGDAIKGPTIMLLSLIYLAFRSKLLDLIPIAVIYFVTSWYLLTERPVDVMVVRLTSFALGSSMAIFWSANLRKLEDWIRSAGALVRRMKEPIVLTDRAGIIILVNHAACTLLQGKEQGFLRRKLLAQSLADNGSISRSLMVYEMEEHLPDGLLGLLLDVVTGPMLARARVFVLGKGKRRIYGFSLEEGAGEAAPQTQDTRQQEAREEQM